MAIKLIRGPETISEDVEKEAVLEINGTRIVIRKWHQEHAETGMYDNGEEYSKNFEELNEEEQDEVRDFVNDDIEWNN